MNKIFTVLFFIPAAIFMSSISAFAECRQANLRSADGSQIAILYSSQGQTNGNSLWVNPTIQVILSDDLCSAQEVIVQLVKSQLGFSSAKPQTLTKSSQVRCGFFATANNVQVANHGGALGQQIAIRVFFPGGDPQWLVDPISHSNNFNYAYKVDGTSPNVEICR